MLAVVVVIGILATVVVSRIMVNRRMCQEKACHQNTAVINGAIEFFFLTNGRWPTDLSEIQSLPNFPDELPVCPVTGEAYTIDGDTNRVAGHTPGNH